MQNELIDLEKRYLAAASDVDELFRVDEQYFHYLKEQLRRDPKDIHALIHLGVLSWEPFHKQEQAIAFLQKAIEYDPTNVEARFWLAKCYYHDFCDYAKAKQLLLEALELDPCRAECLCLLSAIVEDTTKAWDEAINFLERAIQNARDWPMLYLCIGSVYLDIKNTTLAELQVSKIQNLISLPHKSVRNAVEDYFETVVTGRKNKKLQNRLDKLKEIIHKAKKLQYT